MKRKNKFYFIGYKLIENSKNMGNYALLFTTDEAVSFYEALKAFEKHMTETNQRFILLKILDGPNEIEVPEYINNYVQKSSCL